MKNVELIDLEDVNWEDYENEDEVPKCECGEYLHTEFEQAQGVCVGCDDSQI